MESSIQITPSSSARIPSRRKIRKSENLMNGKVQGVLSVRAIGCFRKVTGTAMQINPSF
jgi:hypothetical protein